MVKQRSALRAFDGCLRCTPLPDAHGLACGQSGQNRYMARKPRVIVATGGLLLSVAICLTGCSNIGSSNGNTASGGNPNGTPAGQLPGHSATTLTPGK